MTNRKHIRYQRLHRLRKPTNDFVAFLSMEGERLGAPARALRDQIRALGALDGPALTAAANLAALTSLKRSSAATLDLVNHVTDPTDGDISMGASASAPVSLGQDFGTNLKLGATTGAIALAFVDGGGGTDSITRSTGSFLTDGFRNGCSFSVTGADEAGNAGPFTAVDVSALAITVATGSLTADASDTATLNSLDVVTGGNIGDAVGESELTVSAGPNAGDYHIDIVGLDYAVLSDPLVSVDTDYDEGAICLNVITRSDEGGDFQEDGFVEGAVLTIAGATNGALNGGYEINAVGGDSLIIAPLAAIETTSPATITIGSIVRDGGDFTTTFSAGDTLYAADGRTIGVIDTVADLSIALVGGIPAAFVGSEQELLFTDATITRGSGSFVTDGFAVGQLALLSGSNDSDGIVKLAEVAALTIRIQGALPDDESAVEAVLYLLAQNAREDADPGALAIPTPVEPS